MSSFERFESETPEQSLKFEFDSSEAKSEKSEKNYPYA